MIGLIKREILEKKSVLMILLGVLFFASAPILTSFADAGASSVMSVLFLPFGYLLLGYMQSAMLEDERQISAYFWSTTPKGKNGVIAAKYLMIVMTSLLITVYVIATGALLDKRNEGGSLIIVLAMSLMSLQILFRSIEMPFIFTFGSKNGNYVKMCLIGIVMLLILGYLLFGKLPDSLSLEKMIDWLKKLVENEFFRSKIRLGAILAAGMAVVLTVSYLISKRGYWKGVEEYGC